MGFIRFSNPRDGTAQEFLNHTDPLVSASNHCSPRTEIPRSQRPTTVHPEQRSLGLSVQPLFTPNRGNMVVRTRNWTQQFGAESEMVVCSQGQPHVVDITHLVMPLDHQVMAHCPIIIIVSGLR